LIITMARCFALFVALVDADSECLPSIGANNVFVAQASSLILFLAVQALPSDMHRSLSRGISRSALTPSVGALHFKLDREKASVSRARPGSGRPSQVGVLTLKARLSQGLVGDVAQLQACLEPVIIGTSLGGRRAMHLGEIIHLSPGRNSGRSEILAVEHLFSQVTMTRESAPAEVVAERLAMSERQGYSERMLSCARTSQGLVGDVAWMQAGLDPVIADSSSRGRRAGHLGGDSSLSARMDSGSVQCRG
jgi:hypothetical protein